MSGSQAERRITVPAGATIPVRVPGDFIFIKYVDRPVVVRINDQSITMRAGDSRKIERDASRPNAPAFDIFDLYNEDENAPLAVEFVAGMGSYDSKIIHGEIMSVPSVRRADGVMIPDRRYWRDVWLDWEDTTVASYASREEINKLVTSGSGFSGEVDGGFVDGDRVFFPFSQDGMHFQMFDRRTFEHLGMVTFGSYGGALPTGAQSVSAIRRDYFSNNLMVILISTVTKALYFRKFGVLSSSSSSWFRTDMEVPSGFYDSYGASRGIRLFEVDPLTGLIIGFWGTSPSSSGRTAIAIHHRNGTVLHWFSVGMEISSMAIYRSRSRPDKQWLITTQSGVGVYDHTVIYDLDALLAGVLSVVPLGEFGEDIGGSGTNQIHGGVIVDHDQRQIYTVSANTRWAFALEDFTRAGTFYVSANRSRIVKPGQTPIYGDYTFEGQGRGRTVTGPVIRAALWGMLGDEPPIDYLDHIYQVDFQPGTAQTVVKSAGYDSFARAGFADNFKVQLPARVRLLTDI